MRKAYQEQRQQQSSKHLVFILFCLLVVSCGGGTSGDNGGDGNRSTEDISNRGGTTTPSQVQWSIIPVAGGLEIEWRNLAAFDPLPTFIYLNITGPSLPQGREIKVAIRGSGDNSHRIENLNDGETYHLAEVRVEFADDVAPRVIPIDWLERTDQLSNNSIVVGNDHDRNGLADSVDPDDDKDKVPDDHPDLCPRGLLGWTSDKENDYDRDGCRNGDEDWDDDNDGVNNSRADGTDWDLCPRGILGWTSNASNDPDGDGCRNDEDGDDDNDELLDGDELAGCERDPDCDDDEVLDGRELRACINEADCDKDGEGDAVDIDDDGNGLIEIVTATQLDQVRYQLDGTGYKINATASLNQTGCVDGMGINSCNGYELVRDISLMDHIAETDAIAGWQPIASDCSGNGFTGTFDGNGFKVTDLFINRSTENCIGLFGRTTGTIRHLGVEASRVIGNSVVGGLVGSGQSAEITQSYVVVGEVRGDIRVGGLVGSSDSAEITQSYAVVDEVRGKGAWTGGLVGWADAAAIIRSYAVTGEVSGAGEGIGGLLGTSDNAEIIHSYAVSGEVSGEKNVGGLVGYNELQPTIIQSYAVAGVVRGTGARVGGLVGWAEAGIGIVDSYAVTGKVSGLNSVGGLVGFGLGISIRSSYWDNQTSERDNDGRHVTGSSRQSSMALRSPTDYTGIYSTWDDGAIMEGTTIAGIDRNGSIWCDEDLSGVIEDDEMRDGSDPMEEDNRIWHFGTSSDYPALRCTPDSLSDQRTWWFLNATQKVQLNRTRLDAWLDGSLP